MKGKTVKIDVRRLWENTYADDPLLPHRGTALYKTALQIRNRHFITPENLIYYHYMLSEEHGRYRRRTPKQAHVYAEAFIRIVEQVGLHGYEAGRGRIKVRKREKGYVVSDGHRRLNAMLAFGKLKKIEVTVI